MITNSHLNISTKGNCKNKPQNPSSLMSFDSRETHSTALTLNQAWGMFQDNIM